MYDLVTIDKTYLPGHDVMNTYFLDLTATVETISALFYSKTVKMVDISFGTWTIF